MNLRPLPFTALVLLASLFFGGTLGASDEKKPDFTAWLEDAEGMVEASRLFKEESKPIFVYFYADWCGYCRQFERELLSTEPVEDYFDGGDVVAVRINGERGPAEIEISRRYGVRGYPALFMLNGESGRWTMVDRMVLEDGQPVLKEPGAFVDTLKQASAQ